MTDLSPERIENAARALDKTYFGELTTAGADQVRQKVAEAVLRADTEWREQNPKFTHKPTEFSPEMAWVRDQALAVIAAVRDQDAVAFMTEQAQAGWANALRRVEAEFLRRIGETPAPPGIAADYADSAE